MLIIFFICIAQLNVLFAKMEHFMVSSSCTSTFGFETSVLIEKQTNAEEISVAFKGLY